MSDKSNELSKEFNEVSGKLLTTRLNRLDLLSKKRGWDVHGMDVAYLLFAEKFNWTPQQVRSLTSEEFGLFLDTIE